MGFSLKRQYNRETRRALELQLKALQKKTKCKRKAERLQTVRLAIIGYTLKDIAQIVGRCVKTVKSHIMAFYHSGLQGLEFKRSTGRKPYLTPDQEKEIYDVVTDKTPQESGFDGEMNWTSKFIKQLIQKQFNVKYSDRGVRSLLQRIGMSYTRPTYRLAKADPEKKEQFKQRFGFLRKQLLEEKIDRILFIDETMIRDYLAVSRSWSPKGRQRKIPTYGKHWGTKIIGALDYESGEVFCVQKLQYTAVEFLWFLERLVWYYANQRLVLILDNAKIHHATLLKPFLEEHSETISLEFLPPYCPDLNPIEGLWKWMKQSVINNVFFSNVSQIRVAVAKFLRRIDQERDVVIDRLCVWL